MGFQVSVAVVAVVVVVIYKFAKVESLRFSRILLHQELALVY